MTIAVLPGLPPLYDSPLVNRRSFALSHGFLPRLCFTPVVGLIPARATASLSVAPRVPTRVISKALAQVVLDECLQRLDPSAVRASPSNPTIRTPSGPALAYARLDRSIF